MTLQTRVAATVAGALFLIAATPAAAQSFLSRDSVAAKLGETELRVSALTRTIQAQTPEVRKALRENPDGLANLARNETLRQAVIAKAKQEGYDKRPEVVVHMERSAEQVLVDRYLDSKSTIEAGYPSTAEIQAAYANNSSKFIQPPRVHIAQILLRVATNAPKPEADKTAARAHEVAQRAAQPGADFGALAKLHSQDTPSNEKNGDMGWFELSTLSPEIRSVVAPLKAGEVSKPVKTQFGWQIVKVLAKQEESVRPLAEVTPAIVAALRKQKADESKQKWLANLSGAEGPTVDKQALIEVKKRLAE